MNNTISSKEVTDPTIHHRRTALTVGLTDVTPQAGAILAGYATDIPRTAHNFRQRLHARCTIFWESGRPNIIVTVDVLGFPREIHQIIRANIEKMGVDTSRFMLTATHTHGGPVLTKGSTVFTLYNVKADSAEARTITHLRDLMIEQIVQLVRRTLARTPTDCIFHHYTSRLDHSYNREGMPDVETSVPILAARSPGGTLLAVLFGYGCHPVTAPADNLVDSDYPGAAVSQIEEETGAFAQFLPGAAGDQQPLETRDVESTRKLGRALGKAVADALAEPGHAVFGPVDTCYEELDAKLMLPANMEEFRKNFVDRHQRSQAGWLDRHAKSMIEQIDRNSFTRSVRIPLQSWLFDGERPLRFAIFGGEPVAGYAKMIRNLARGETTWLIGYAGEVPAYLPTNELLTTGGSLHYACGWSPDYPNMGGGAMAAYGLIGRFRRADEPPGIEASLLAKFRTMIQHSTNDSP
ncbi:hypothetical protein AB0L41_38165 [Amycolatopsis mediterranei]|uniref:hypothetical protein n=1 Tax=Amycolatopsis mediterranei TaxID=33910 RepID=UPI003439D602